MSPKVMTFLAAALHFSTVASAQTVFVTDALTAGSAAGRGARGGSFGPDGWTVSAEDDTVWFELDEALPNARVEFKVTGLSIGPGGTLSGTDHDIVTVYQAPIGQSEPVAYSPYFRNNDFKAFIRIFGNQEIGRPGAMKLELAACPRGEPWHHDTACPANCEISGIGYANGNQNDVGWDPNLTYTMAVEWGGGAMRVFRDGTLLGNVPINGDYAPRPLRVRFGSPRHQGVYPGQAMMPLGIKFKDVVISGTPGAMTPQCGMAPVGGGAGGGGGPMGGGGGGGGAPMVPGELRAEADVTAASWETGVFPDVTDLNVEGSGAVVYLRFPAVMNGASSARLVLHTSTGASAGGGSGRVCAVNDNAWNEATLTWNNRPATGACVGLERSVDADSDVEWDVTSLVRVGVPTSLAIISNDGNGAHYWSKESGQLVPRLLVVEATVPPVAPDAGTLAPDAGMPPVVGTPPVGGGGPGEQTELTMIDARGGCGCTSSSGAFLVMLTTLLWRSRRR